MGITAKELAKKLNISAAAVSMALHNKPGVSTQTRQRILDAALQYGYDFTKLSEKKVTEGAVYLVIYKKHGAVVSDTPFFSEVTEGISLECKNNRYRLKISYIYEDEETLRKQIEDLQYSDCMGIILLGTEMTEQDLDPFLKLPVPVVLLDAYFDMIPCNCITINNLQGAYMATRHLIQKTNCQPGYLRSSYQISNFAERATGFYNAVRASGMSASKSIVHRLSPSVEGACADMLELIRAGEPLAHSYFADNDLIAVGFIKALKQSGLSVPADAAVVGFDNMPVSSVIEPALTTVHVPKQYMGSAAVQRLASLLKDPGQTPVRIQISTSLVKRQSIQNFLFK